MSDAKYKQLPALGIAVAVDDGKTSSSSGSSSRPPSRGACRALCKFLLLLTLSTALLAALLAGAAYSCGRHLVRAAGGAVLPRITSDRPLDLPPPVFLSETELDDLDGRLGEFHRALHRGEAPPRDLVLTEREINGLICSADDHRHHHHDRDDDHPHHHHHHHDRREGESEMCGKVYATVSTDTVSADFSIPADDHVPGGLGSGRYFVGTKSLLVAPRPGNDGRQGEEEGPSETSSSYSVRSALVVRGPDSGGDDFNDAGDDFPLMDATANVDLRDDGTLDVRVESAEVFGWAATDAFVGRFLGGRNLAGDMCDHAASALRHIEGVDIGDGKVVVRVRGRGFGPEEMDAAEAEEVDGWTRRFLRSWK